MRVSKMHILLLTPGFPENEDDCRCIPPLQAYCKSLFSVPNVRISVLVLQYPASNNEYIWNKIKVYPCHKGSGKINQLRTWHNALNSIRQIHKRDPISIIHSFWMTEAAFVGKVASTFFHIPTLVTLMGQDARISNKYLKLGQLSKSIIAISSNQANLFKVNTGRQVLKIIPWGISPEINNDEIQDTSDFRDVDLLGVGSLIPVKNYLAFVEVVAEIARTLPQVKACLIGEGPEKEKLVEKIRERGLEKNLRLEGSLPRRQVLRYMARSKVFVHPALYEGQGYVFYEALEKGCRIVSYDVGVAEHSPYWEIGKNIGEMVSFVKVALLQGSERKSQAVPTMDNTTLSYCKIYQLLVASSTIS